jgi:hypothetical protein
MVNEGNPFPRGRDSRVADPTARLVENLVDREFQTALAAHVPHYRETISIRRPIGPLHVVENFTRSASGQGHSRQRADVDVRPNLLAVEQHGQLSGGRNRQNLGAGQLQRTRLQAFWTGNQDFQWTALPGRAVHDTLSIGSEACHADRAPAKGDLAIRGRRWARPTFF